MVAKKCTTRTNYGKVLGVRAQAITGTRINCPSFNLVLKKKKKKIPFPSVIREKSGEGAWTAYCLPLLGPTGSESSGKEWNLAGGRTRVEEEVTQFPVWVSQTLGSNCSPEGQNSISSF